MADDQNASPLDGYSLDHSADDHYVLSHPDKGQFTIARTGLPTDMDALIGGLPTRPDPAPDTGDTASPASAPVPANSDKYANQPSLWDIVKSAGHGLSYLNNLGAVHPTADPNSTPAHPDPNVQQASDTQDTTPPPSPTQGLPKSIQPQANNPPMSAYDPSGYMKAFGEQAAGIQGQAKAEGDVGKQNALVQQQLADQLVQVGKAADAEHATMKADNDRLMKDYGDGKVKPHQFWDNMSNGNRVLAAISLALGGIGGGLTGKGGNVALDIINKSIDDDINAQKANLDKTHNLLSLNMQKSRDMNEAEVRTRINLLSVAQAQMAKNVASGAGPEAQARAQQAMGALDMQKTQLMQSLALQKAATNPAAPAGAKIRILVPEKQQEGAYKELGEISKAQGLQQSGANIFDKVASLQNIANRVGDPIQSKKQITALVEPYIGQLAHESDGRVTPQEMDQMRSLMPAVADTDQTRMVKKSRLLDLIRSKAAPTPILDSYGITQSAGAAPAARVGIAFTPIKAQTKVVKY